MLCGPAVTVRVRPGDNLMIHKALMMVEAGDVLVIDGGGDLTQALVGGLMRTTCIAKKLGGLVIDGAIRDLLEWAEDGMPIFARGHTHRGPSKDGPGRSTCRSPARAWPCMPGDLMLGDADGVIAIPAAEVAALLLAPRAHLAKEAKIRADNAAGTVRPGALRRDACAPRACRYERGDGARPALAGLSGREPLRAAHRRRAGGCRGACAGCSRSTISKPRRAGTCLLRSLPT